VREIATEVGATPAQIAIAWLLAKGDDIVPIPGTKRVSRVEENIAADNVELTADQLGRLDNLPVASGGHHNEAQMQTLERKSGASQLGTLTCSAAQAASSRSACSEREPGSAV
jgi:diketogulonate reductase-like aldo/keto reductase